MKMIMAERYLAATASLSNQLHVVVVNNKKRETVD
jgi:hypothetical protein